MVEKPLEKATGCGAAWLARLTGGQKVAGSNPVTPTRLTTIWISSVTKTVTNKPPTGPNRSGVETEPFGPASVFHWVKWEVPNVSSTAKAVVS